MFWRRRKVKADPVRAHVRRALAYYLALEQQQPLSEWQKGRKSALEAVWQVIIHS